MRYTENKYNSEINTVLDVVNWIFVSLIMAPFRLINEISNKIMYLERQVIEKLVVVTAVIITAFLVWDGIVFFASGELSLVGGTIPIVSKFLALMLVAGFASYTLKKFEFAYEAFEDEEVVEVEEQEEVEEIEEAEVEEVEEYEEVEELVDVKESQIIELNEEEEDDVILVEEVEAVPVPLVSAPQIETLDDLLGNSYENNYSELLSVGELTLEPLSEEITLESVGEEPFISEVDFESLHSILNDNTVFGSRSEKDLSIDIGRDKARRLAELDKLEEDLV